MEHKICSIGAGLSGLAAAIKLEDAGYSPVIYESTSRAGGRVKTDIVEGYQLDHGFQVLLDAYPKAKEYFDYDALKLQRILPGTIVYSNDKTVTLGDPSRHFPFLIPTLSSGIAGLRDLVILFNLHRKVQGMSEEEIFGSKDMSTLVFLREKGFSDRIITRFFKPFFTGIFLEPELRTSCRMFQFVFKMFGKGYAVIPKAGMKALPDQLQVRLKRTSIHYNTPVSLVEEGKVHLKDGRSISADAILVATESSGILKDGDAAQVSWNSSDTLYFETGKRTINKPMIGLISEEDALVNNIFYPTSLDCEKRGPKELLSVTVVKEHSLDETALINKVGEELRSLCGISDLRFLKRYRIKRSLPHLHSLRSQWQQQQGRVGKNIFMAGDHLLYGSSNAALLSGEAAARSMIEALQTSK